MKNQDIYEMKLHDYDYMSEFKIIRVAGGWIYQYLATSNATAVFVPFNNEFQEKVEDVEGLWQSA